MNYAVFTPEMKETHTILIPDMLPVHFGLLTEVFREYGYKTELLTFSGREVVEEGLKNVHNDACYPALLVIGQFMTALKSGRYDPDRTALMISQTGGGCRASNYIHLLRKALSKEYPQIPVLSLNFSGLEQGSGFRITPIMLMKMMYAVLYADMIMSLYNQCRPYELHEGDSIRVRDECSEDMRRALNGGDFTGTKKHYRRILEKFSAIERTREKKVRVGIVGEIYVKYSPLANNHLEDFLIAEGCEPVVPAFLDFCLYCLANTLNDKEYYGMKPKAFGVIRLAYNMIYKKQREMIRIVEKYSSFEPPHDFEELRGYADKYISQGVKMGEGWLIPAEMAALAEHGTGNIICTQPFGCLPNHIVARGVARTIKKAYPDTNIAAVDYDPGAARVNQENRIKLMLANARK